MTWALSSMNAVGWTRGVTPRNGRITSVIIRAGGAGRAGQAKASRSAGLQACIGAGAALKRVKKITPAWGPASAGLEEIRLKADATGDSFTGPEGLRYGA